MRLVDLDSKDFGNHLETGTEEFARGIRFVWSVLNEQPVVEAIPVEFIKKWQADHTMPFTERNSVITHLLAEWEWKNHKEKENADVC